MRGCSRAIARQDFFCLEGGRWRVMAPWKNSHFEATSGGLVHMIFPFQLGDF